MKEQFNELLSFPNESYMLSTETYHEKKRNNCNKLFNNLHDKNKKDIIEVLKTNRLSKDLKEILTEEEILFLKGDNKIFKFDYYAILCILQAETKLSLKNKTNDLYKQNNLN